MCKSLKLPRWVKWSSATAAVPHFCCEVDLHCQVAAAAATSTQSRCISLHMQRCAHYCFKLYTFFNVCFGCLHYLVLTTYIHAI